MNGTEMAKEIRAEAAEGVAEMRDKHGIVPGLAVVLVGDDPASKVYVRNKDRAATEAGMVSESIVLPDSTTQDEVLSVVRRLNGDARIHAILVQLPLPDHIDEDAVIESINPDKDVDGLHPFNMGLLMAGLPRFIPATPEGIQQMLLRSGFDPEGKHVVVCGRSNIVGKPVANLLMQRSAGSNATVTVCHTRTKNLADITRQADILIAAIGQPRFITADMVKDGVVVIDVGINQIAPWGDGGRLGPPQCPSRYGWCAGLPGPPLSGRRCGRRWRSRSCRSHHPPRRRSAGLGRPELTKIP